MRILMVCSELAPLAKTGGLADAVTGLASALCARGQDVRVLLPQYAHLKGAARPVGALGGSYRYGEVEPAYNELPGRRGRGSTPRIYLLDLAELTADGVYTGDSRDAGRFMRLAAAATELGNALGWHPQILHCHAALVPVLAGGDSVPSVLTLHNVGYQGVFADSVLDDYDMPELRDTMATAARGPDTVNFLRAGVAAADRVTTVSPTYATEIRTPAFGMGLEDLLAARGDEVVGILNGVDYGVWSPATDPFIELHYDAEDLTPKYRLKGALAVRLGLLPDQNAPLIGIVTRLATQKGIDLVTAVLPTLLRETRANFTVLGSGDAAIAAELRRLAADNPRRVSFTDGYDEQLAHHIFAGCDVTLVPSRYEPCGLTQMYALRYGTIPVVRATGGLADTIEHYDPATGLGNGSVFRDANPEGLLWGIRTALQWFDEPSIWSRLVANAMAADFSWQRQVGHYEALYRSLALD
jgi:starch synthase